MKLAGARALAFCDKPQGKTRVALVFGGDPGLVSTAADMLAERWVPGIDPFNLVKLSDDDLKRDPQTLADELVARSLMGGDRLVRVRIDRETSADVQPCAREAMERSFASWNRSLAVSGCALPWFPAEPRPAV